MPSLHDPPSGGSRRPTGVRPLLTGKVLLVDDTPVKRYLVSQSLRRVGMEIVEVFTGREALAALDLQPDVVVLDVRLPDMSGYEVCRRIKANPATAAIPVLYMSSLVQDDELETRLSEDGADGYIPQPIEPRHLVAQTWALVRLRRAEREREAARAEQHALRRQLESSETRLRQALEAAELGSWNYDFATHAWHLDARAKALLGLPAEAPVDVEGWRSRVHPEDQARVSELVRRVSGGEQEGVFTTDFRTPGGEDGVPRWVSVRGQVSFAADGQGPRASGLWLDVTERKRAGEEERPPRQEARDRVALEQQFLGRVSHDLRNPLQAISLGASTLQRVERPSPELLARLADRIASSAGTMGRMVADLMDFTRVRLGGGISLEKAQGDLVRVCREVLDELAPTHPDRPVVLEGDATCEGCWDGPRLRQVIRNLVGHALRHAREGSGVRVEARCVGPQGVLSVHHEGEPIAEELRPVLFEPPRQGGGPLKPPGSLGLELYIARQVVEGHGGTVDVASGAEGTTFTVRMPRAG